MDDHLRDATKKVDFISREAAMSMPLANGQYDHEHANEHFILGLESYKEWLEYVPAADVRPVVLCKDCRHRDPEDNKCDCGQLERAGCVFPVDDNYWCAHGEKGETNAKD